MKILKKLTILIISFLAFFNTQAAHIIGGEITYVCLGNNEYEFTMKIYRDCASTGAQFDSTVGSSTEGSVTVAFRTDLTNPYGEFIVNTLKNKLGEDVVQIRIMGGTVPISPFINELKIPAFIVPMVNPDNNQHSPNENLKIGQIAYGIKVFYGLLSTKM